MNPSHDLQGLKKKAKETFLYVLSALLLGIAIGAIDAVFGRVLLFITDFRSAHIVVLLPFLPNFSAHLKAVLIRQIDVQKNQVSPRRKGGFCDKLKIATTGTLVSVFFKKLGKFLTDCWFIFYDKNFHFVALYDN